ncbi:MAG: hypothetical protein VYE18_03600 [Pseudomonadota bacterium]|nr:hypothetical protein [Pseudomonadota bacterium]
MRYSVRYEGAEKSWFVIGGANQNQVIGVHDSKSAAYEQAFAEQARLRKIDPAAMYLGRIRSMLPRTLVVR